MGSCVSMFSNKILSFTFALFLTISSFGYAQIVTSKKVTIQKGIYQKPIDKKAITEKTTEKTTKVVVAPEKKKTELTSEKTIKQVVAAETKKEIKPTKNTTKSKKYLVDNVDDSDLLPAPKEDYLAVQLINNAMAFVGVKYHVGGI